MCWTGFVVKWYYTQIYTNFTSAQHAVWGLLSCGCALTNRIALCQELKECFIRYCSAAPLAKKLTACSAISTNVPVYPNVECIEVRYFGRSLFSIISCSDIDRLYGNYLYKLVHCAIP